MEWFLPQMFNSGTIVALAGNGLGLCEGKELELQMLKISTNVE